MIELKPCPHCGQPPEWAYCDEEGSPVDGETWEQELAHYNQEHPTETIADLDEYIEICGGQFILVCYRCRSYIVGDSRDETVAAWNRRVGA